MASNPFVGSWMVSFAPLRECGKSIGHPFGRTGRLDIQPREGADNGLTCFLDQDRSGQDFTFHATWQAGVEGGPASMSADIDNGNRTYRIFAYLRMAEGGPKVLGHLERVPRPPRGPQADSEAMGSWIGIDHNPPDPL
jgi:hypothetical protein